MYIFILLFIFQRKNLTATIIFCSIVPIVSLQKVLTKKQHPRVPIGCNTLSSRKGISPTIPLNISIFRRLLLHFCSNHFRARPSFPIKTKEPVRFQQYRMQFGFYFRGRNSLRYNLPNVNLTVKLRNHSGEVLSQVAMKLKNDQWRTRAASINC